MNRQEARAADRRARKPFVGNINRHKPPRGQRPRVERPPLRDQPFHTATCNCWPNVLLEAGVGQCPTCGSPFVEFRSNGIFQALQRREAVRTPERKAA
mgnify:CR=1 FL=1